MKGELERLPEIQELFFKTFEGEQRRMWIYQVEELCAGVFYHSSKIAPKDTILHVVARHGLATLCELELNKRYKNVSSYV